MAEVHAIKQRETVGRIGELLQQQFGQQMSDIWNVGLNLALRISDLLSVRFTNIENDRLILTESKTGKTANIQLNDKARSILQRIRQEHPEHEYVFQSFRNNQARQRCGMPLSRRSVTKAFSAIGKRLNVSLGTHSMRKTRGYHLYKATNDIARVMKMLRHSSEEFTLRYIGITQEDVDRDFKELEL